MSPVDVVEQLLNPTWCVPYEISACQNPRHKGPCKGQRRTKTVCTGTGKNRRCRKVPVKKAPVKKVIQPKLPTPTKKPMPRTSGPIVGDRRLPTTQELNPRRQRDTNDVAPRVARLPRPKGSSAARKVRRSHTASAGGPMPVTLTIAGTPLTFTPADPLDDLFGPVSFCRHPIVHPGPCKGWKGTAKKALSGGRRKRKPKPTPKTPAAATAKAPAKAKVKSGPATGKPSLYQSLPYEDIAKKSTDNNRSDDQLKMIAEAQGFDAKPQLADRAELDKLEAAGGTRLWRAIGSGANGKTSADLADELRDGPVFYGQNARGNGIITDTDLNTALRKAGGGGVAATVEMVLPATARVATRDEIAALADARAKLWARRQTWLLGNVKRTTDPAERQKALDLYDNWRQGKTGRDSVLADPGRLAAALGFDAIADRDPNTGKLSNVTVLNRGSLVALDPKTVKPQPTAPTTPNTPSGATPGSQPARPRPAGTPSAPSAPGGNTAVQPTVPQTGAPAPAAGATVPIKRKTGNDITGKVDFPKLATLKSDDGTGYDEKLGYLGKLQGYDGAPTRVTQQQMDDLVKAGGVQIWRGIANFNNWRTGEKKTGEDMAEQFRTGTFHYGQGIYGNGVYSSTNKNTAESYAGMRGGGSANNKPGLLRMVLHPNAKTIDYSEAQRRASTEDHKRIADLQKKLMADLAKTTDATKRADIAQKLQDLRTTRKYQFGDTSQWAIANGYDAVTVPQHAGEKYYVLLNRTAVAVEDRNLTAANAPKPPKLPAKVGVAENKALSTIGKAAGGKFYPNGSRGSRSISQATVDKLIQRGFVTSHVDAYGNPYWQVTQPGRSHLLTLPV